VVTWHLNILEKFHFIDSGKEGKQKIYYPREFSYDDAKLLNLINRKKCKYILKEFLTTENPLSINKISKKISISRKAVSNYIEKLMTFNLIEKQPHSFYHIYSLNKKIFRDFIENFKEFEDIRPWLTLLK
jgi:predicted transcriptional regulator